MTLRVDDRLVGQVQATDLIPRDPNDGLQIGADTGSPVDKKTPANFHGQIQRVRIYHGSL